MSGEGRGVWYSANNLSVFGLLQGYLRVTGDYGLLDEKAGSKTVLEHMKGLVTGWKQLVAKDGQLADYGEAKNLLECDSNYIHAVASLNAANVGMMRMLASLLEWRGDAQGAAELRADAKVPGGGRAETLRAGGGRLAGRAARPANFSRFATCTISLPRKWMAEDLSPRCGARWWHSSSAN